MGQNKRRIKSDQKEREERRKKKQWNQKISEKAGSLMKKIKWKKIWREQKLKYEKDIEKPKW